MLNSMNDINRYICTNIDHPLFNQEVYLWYPKSATRNTNWRTQGLEFTASPFGCSHKSTTIKLEDLIQAKTTYYF